MNPMHLLLAKAWCQEREALFSCRPEGGMWLLSHLWPRQLLPHGGAPSRPPCSLQVQARPGLLDAWIAEPRPGRERGGEEYLFHLVDRALPLSSPSLAVGCLCASVYDHAYQHGRQSQLQASHQAGKAQAAHGSCTLPQEKAGGHPRHHPKADWLKTVYLLWL